MSQVRVNKIQSIKVDSAANKLNDINVNNLLLSDIDFIRLSNWHHLLRTENIFFHNHIKIEVTTL